MNNMRGAPPAGGIDPSNTSDDQLKSMLDMMKSNPDMMKQMMKSQGMEMSDDQLKMMTSFMTPEML